MMSVDEWVNKGFVPPELRGILPEDPIPVPPEVEWADVEEPPPDVAAQLEREEPAPVVEAIPFLSGSAIAAPLPPLEYLIPRMGMPSGGGAPHMAAGYGFSGKTLASQVLLLCLAANRKVWGVFDGPGRPLSVGHVDAEQGEALTRKRYQRAGLGHGIDLVADVGDRLRLYCYPKTASGHRITLKRDDANWWREMMTGLDLLAVDSMAALSGGVDENSREQREALDMLGELSSDTKCRPLVIHHSTKPSVDGGRESRYSIRGSGAIYDALDSAYIFSGEKGESIKVEHVKARSHGEPTDDFALAFADVEENGDAKAGVTCTVFGVEVIAEQRDRARTKRQEESRGRAADRLLSALRGGPLDQATLKAKAGVDGSTFPIALSSLNGRIIVTDTKDGRVWKKIYRLVGS